MTVFTVVLLVEHAERLLNFLLRVSVVMQQRQHLEEDVEVDEAVACKLPTSHECSAR